MRESRFFFTYLEVYPEVVPTQVEEEVRGELEVDRFNERKRENRHVHVHDKSLSALVPGDQFLGVIGSEAKVLAVILIGFVAAVDFSVAFITERNQYNGSLSYLDAPSSIEKTSHSRPEKNTVPVATCCVSTGKT